MAADPVGTPTEIRRFVKLFTSGRGCNPARLSPRAAPRGRRRPRRQRPGRRARAPPPEAGEAAEGGEQGRRSAPTRKQGRGSRCSPAPPGQRRMDVPRQAVAAVRIGRLVAEDERRHERRGVDAVDPEVVRRVARVAVVVAPHQQDLERRGQAPPAAQLREGVGGDPAGLSVEQVAQHDHAAGRRCGAARCRAGPGRRWSCRWGSGIPAARKVAALPQWRSATTRVLVLGQNSARSASRYDLLPGHAGRARRSSKACSGKPRSGRAPLPRRSAAFSSGAAKRRTRSQQLLASSPAPAPGPPAAGRRAA